MKYYICDKCLFQFTRYNEPDRCPDCGKEAIREATPEEKLSFIKNEKDFSFINKPKS